VLVFVLAERLLGTADGTAVGTADKGAVDRRVAMMCASLAPVVMLV
jgi:hypothetical protein